MTSAIIPWYVLNYSIIKECWKLMMTTYNLENVSAAILEVSIQSAIAIFSDELKSFLWLKTVFIPLFYLLGALQCFKTKKIDDSFPKWRKLFEGDERSVSNLQQSTKKCRKFRERLAAPVNSNPC